MLNRDYEGSVSIAGIGAGSLKSTNHDFGKNAVVMDSPWGSLESELAAIEEKYGVRVAYEKPESSQEPECEECSKLEKEIAKHEARVSTKDESFFWMLGLADYQKDLDKAKEKYAEHVKSEQKPEESLPDSEQVEETKPKEKTGFQFLGFEM